MSQSLRNHIQGLEQENATLRTKAAFYEHWAMQGFYAVAQLQSRCAQIELITVQAAVDNQIQAIEALELLDKVQPIPVASLVDGEQSRRDARAEKLLRHQASRRERRREKAEQAS